MIKKHLQINHVEETENVKWYVLKIPQYIMCIFPTLCWWGGSSLKIFCFPPVSLKLVSYAIPTLNRIPVNIGTRKHISYNFNWYI